MNNYENYLIKIFDQVKNNASPKVIGEVNDVHIKLAKIKGNDIPWHRHEYDDEMVLVIRGSLRIDIKHMENITLCENEYYIVKKGIIHRIYSKDECWLFLIENKPVMHSINIQPGIACETDGQC